LDKAIEFVSFPKPKFMTVRNVDYMNKLSKEFPNRRVRKRKKDAINKKEHGPKKKIKFIFINLFYLINL
jgi:hypothetical protein